MYRVFGFAAVVFVATSFGTLTSAYGTQPDDVVQERDRAQDVQIADACLPKLSPQMAAAFGLPIMQPGTQACAQG